MRGVQPGIMQREIKVQEERKHIHCILLYIYAYYYHLEGRGDPNSIFLRA